MMLTLRQEEYAPKLLLRSQQVSNSPEIIRRLGVIGMNTVSAALSLER